MLEAYESFRYFFEYDEARFPTKALAGKPLTFPGPRLPDEIYTRARPSELRRFTRNDHEQRTTIAGSTAEFAPFAMTEAHRFNPQLIQKWKKNPDGTERLATVVNRAAYFRVLYTYSESLDDAITYLIWECWKADPLGLSIDHEKQLAKLRKADPLLPGEILALRCEKETLGRMKYLVEIPGEPPYVDNPTFGPMFLHEANPPYRYDEMARMPVLTFRPPASHLDDSVTWIPLGKKPPKR